MVDRKEINSIKKKLREKEELKLFEAALYVAGRPLGYQALGRLIKTKSKRKIRKLLYFLINDYKERHSSLEILSLDNDRYVLQLKSKFSPKVRKLAVKPLLSNAPLKTLSYIAYKQPVTQKEVIEMRGRHSYGHVKQLIDMNLIEDHNHGRTKMLKTSEYFADYFGLSYDINELKKKLIKIFGKTYKESNTSKMKKNK